MQPLKHQYSVGMINILLLIFASIVLALVFDKLQSKIVARFPKLKHPIAHLNHFGKAAFLVASIYSAFWVVVQSSLEPKHLPSDIHPPALNGLNWAVYDADDEDNSELSMLLPAAKDDDGNAQVWNRFDDKTTGETTLTLTRYDCERNNLSEVLSVFFKNGAYDGYDNLDEKEKIKVDLGTADGAGYLLACQGIKPSSI